MKNESGLTLVELMVTMALIAIMLSIAVPGFQSYIRNNRLATQTNEIVGAINYTRSEAVKRGEVMQLRMKPAGWADGWEIVDPNNLPPASPVLREGQGVVGGHTIVAGGTPAINFSPTGFADVTPTFTVCGKNGYFGRQIMLTPTGRPSVKRDYMCP